MIRLHDISFFLLNSTRLSSRPRFSLWHGLLVVSFGWIDYDLVLNSKVCPYSQICLVMLTVPFEEDDKDPSIWFLDHNYHESMFSMFKRINGMVSIPWSITLIMGVNVNSFSVIKLVYLPSSQGACCWVV